VAQRAGVMLINNTEEPVDSSSSPYSSYSGGGDGVCGGDEVVEVEQLVLAGSVITSSFGCAHTHASPSSSRFGQYLQLHYSSHGFLEGAVMRTFLLETGRVTGVWHQHQRQGQGQHRNFNVFNQVTAGLLCGLRFKLCL
jgi:myosin heavy subunit